MAVSTHSVKPSPPRKPPAVAPCKGVSGQAGVPYGHTHTLPTPGTFTSSDGKGRKAGKEHSNEGSTSKASKPGYE